MKTEEGQNIQIRCIVEGNPEPAIQWDIGGKNLPSTVQYQNKKGTILIQNITVKDSGSYRCIAENILAKSTDSTFVAVYKQLSFFYKSPNSMSFLQSQDITLSCIHSYGAPPITINWYKDGKELPDGLKVLRKDQILQIQNVRIEDAGNYRCLVKSFSSVIQNTVRFQVYVVKTCQELRRAGQTKSGTYIISPTGDVSEQVQVYCDMVSRQGEGITIISHDSEARILVNGHEGVGTYKRKINYNIPLAQIKALVKISASCLQFIKYECLGSILYLDRKDVFAWWVSVSGQRMTNWGGVNSNRKGCACSLTNSCIKGTCMCDVNGGGWKEDSGYLSEKEYLPVTELRFGDTGDSGEKGYHSLGKLKCY